MGAPVTDIEIFTPTFDKLDASLTTYVADVSSGVITAIAPVGTQLMVLYFVIYGIAMMRGMIQEPVTDFLMRVIKVVGVTAFALNIGIYNGQIAAFLWNSPDAMATIISGGAYVGDNSVTFLDTVLTNMYRLGQTFWDYSSGMMSVDLGPKLIAILVWCVAVLVTGYGAFLLALAKTALAVLLALGPIFILLAMFEGTKRFFESWMGQALNFVFVAIITSAILRLILTLLDQYLPPAITAASATGAISTAVETLVLAAVAGLVLMQVNQISSALGGGVAVSTLGAGAALLGKLKGGAQGASNLLTGKTLSDMRAAKMRRANINDNWQRYKQANPSMVRRGAGMAMDMYRKKISPPNKVAKAS